MRRKKVKISLLTVGRMDWSYCAPLVAELRRRREVRMRLLVSGSHAIRTRGCTAGEIIKEGFRPDAIIKTGAADDSPLGITRTIGKGIVDFADEFQAHKPDILVVNGDRFETLSAVVAAHIFNIVIVHIGGGERTEGVIDEGVRHAITKMSHLHFVECGEYKDRVVQMGEDKKRVFDVGSLSIESMKKARRLSLRALRKRLGRNIEDRFLTVTFHPDTLASRKENKTYITHFLNVLEQTNLYCVFTYPNTDTNNSVIVWQIKLFLKRYKRGCFLVSTGKENYYNLMRHCLAIVGNSSSGIIEAPYFKTPVVNVGTRQMGRVRADNIIDSGYGAAEIAAAIKKAISPGFRQRIMTLKNPFAGRKISMRIADEIIDSYEKWDKDLLLKEFNDNPC